MKPASKPASTKSSTRRKTSQHVNRRNVWLIVATALLVLGSVFMFTPPQEKFNQGLDIQGGLSVVLTAKGDDGATVSAEDMGEVSRGHREPRKLSWRLRGHGCLAGFRPDSCSDSRLV